MRGLEWLRDVFGDLFSDFVWSYSSYRDFPRPERYKTLEETQAYVKKSSLVQREIDLFCTEKSISRRDVELKVERMVGELASLPDDRVIRAFAYVLRKLFHQIFRGVSVDLDGLEKVRKASSKAPLIYLPTHKSHFDYLILSYVNVSANLEAPYIVGGDNMNIPLLGWVFRHSGAFFIRRSFGSDQLYKSVFFEYLMSILEDGHTLEFFIEGGRSRSGKLLRPKMGIMNNLVDGFLKGRFGDYNLCPVCVQYETVAEVESYSNELLGARKQKESLTGVLTAASSVLRLNFGSIHVRFGTPFSLEEYISSFIAERSLPRVLEDSDQRKLVSALGYKVVYDLNQNLVAMPAAMVAAVLLAHPGRGLSFERLVRWYKWLEQEVSSRGAPLAAYQSSTLDMVQRTVKKLSKLFEKSSLKSGYVEPFPSPRCSMELSFYRNQIIHLFVPECLVAISLHAHSGSDEFFPNKNVLRSDLSRSVKFLSQLLKFEFVYKPSPDFEENVDDTLMRLQKEGLLLVEDERVRLTESGEKSRLYRFLRGLIYPFIDAYWCGILVLFSFLPRRLTTQRAFIDLMRAVAQSLYFEGATPYSEIQSQDLMTNVLTYLEMNNVLSFKLPLSDSSRSADRLAQLSDEYQNEDSLKSLIFEVSKYRAACVNSLSLEDALEILRNAQPTLRAKL